MAVLTDALVALIRDGDGGPSGAYSAACLSRVWRATHFSWWMTSNLHVPPGQDAMDEQLQLSQLRYAIASRAAATTLAENYCGVLARGRAGPGCGGSRGSRPRTASARYNGPHHGRLRGVQGVAPPDGVRPGSPGWLGETYVMSRAAGAGAQGGQGRLHAGLGQRERLPGHAAGVEQVQRPKPVP